MIIPGTNLVKRKHIIMMICGTILLIVSYVQAFSQEPPPKPITVTVITSQNLTFGTIIQGGNNGTVTVSPQGVRSATGSVILPNINSIVTPALFEVEAIPGTLINISNGTDALLSGGGFNMTMQIGDSYPKSPFITTGAITQVRVGGTLIVGPLSSNPIGVYSGTFNVTFIQQ
jgi:hypothetical protein